MNDRNEKDIELRLEYCSCFVVKTCENVVYS